MKRPRKSLIEGCDWLHHKYKTEKIPPLQVLAMTGKVFLPVEDGEAQASLLPELKTLVESALDDLKNMRELEGARLKTLLEEGVAELTKHAGLLTALAPEHPKKIREKLTQRISQWGTPPQAESQRLEWEIAFYADRADITEEIDRLKSHAKEFANLLQGNKGVGRKLDFLTQELHREVNTMGSKATLIEITRLTVEAKTLVEKLREQVQNVE